MEREIISERWDEGRESTRMKDRERGMGWIGWEARRNLGRITMRNNRLDL
jgi:hypothetical protein